MSAESRRKALPISLASRLVTIHGFSCRVLLSACCCSVEQLEGVHRLTLGSVSNRGHPHHHQRCEHRGVWAQADSGLDKVFRELFEVGVSPSDGFGLTTSPTEGRIVLPHSPALSERQKSQGLG